MCTFIDDVSISKQDLLMKKTTKKTKLKRYGVDILIFLGLILERYKI